MAAIDFGTTYSRYSFVIKKDVIDDPESVYCPQWYGDGDAVSLKVPTTVLLDEKKKFVDFRYKVEEQLCRDCRKKYSYRIILLP